MTDQVFYIFVNSDLNMSRGQQTAQIVHITQIIVEELVKKIYESRTVLPECLSYKKWIVNPVTVILKATSEQLAELIKLEGAKGFIDSGNRIPDNSLTVVGFYPNNKMSEMVKEYKLL